MAWEEKQTKAQINKETCRAELLANAKAGLPIIVICLVLVAVVAIVFLCVDTHNTLGNFLALLIGILCTGFDFYFIWQLVHTFRSITKGNFEIREDVLSSVEIETVRRRSRHGYTYHEKKVFYFDEHGRYETGAIDGSAFEYSSAGDRFYIVVRKSKRKNLSPLRVYNAKVYEYRE